MRVVDHDSIEDAEVFEGIVEIRKISRVPGYKTKIALISNNSEVDPVGTCVGVGGSRIKPILKELGQEKVDLIAWPDNLEALVRGSLKPAVVDAIKIDEDGSAIVWLAEDQRSFAIGKMGQNITLASELAGVALHLQTSKKVEDEGLFAEDNVTDFGDEPVGEDVDSKDAGVESGD